MTVRSKRPILVTLICALFAAPSLAVPPPAVSNQQVVRLYPGTSQPDSAISVLLACWDTNTAAFQYASTAFPCVTGGSSSNTTSSGTGTASSSGSGYTAISGAPRFVTTTISAGQAAQLFAATTSGAARTMFSITVPASGDADLECTDDGSTPSNINADFVVYAHGNTYRSAPEFVSNQALQCFVASGSARVTAEVYP